MNRGVGASIVLSLVTVAVAAYLLGLWNASSSVATNGNAVMGPVGRNVSQSFTTVIQHANVAVRNFTCPHCGKKVEDSIAPPAARDRGERNTPSSCPTGPVNVPFRDQPSRGMVPVESPLTTNEESVAASTVSTSVPETVWRGRPYSRPAGNRRPIGQGRGWRRNRRVPNH